MKQANKKRVSFLYVIILVLIFAVGFLFYKLNDRGNSFESLFYGNKSLKKRSSEKGLVDYEKPATRKSNYMIHSHGYSQFWDPYSEMKRMHEQVNQVLKSTLDRFHEHGFEDFQRFNFNLNAEVTEDNEYYVLQIAIPNVQPDSVEVNVTDKQLKLKGINEESVEEKDAQGNVVQSEMKSTSFFRSINFPEKVDPNSLEKKIENGVLQIKLKKQSAKKD